MVRKITALPAQDVAVDPATGALLVGGLECVAGPDLVTVDATAGGKTLETLLGRPLESGLQRLLLIPAGAVYWARGAASAASAPVPTTGIDLPVSKTQADLRRFYAAAGVAMTVLQFG